MAIETEVLNFKIMADTNVAGVPQSPIEAHVKYRVRDTAHGIKNIKDWITRTVVFSVDKAELHADWKTRALAAITADVTP
jgi:hypothetical protein